MEHRSRIGLVLLGVATVVCPLALAHIWFDKKTVHFKEGDVDFGEPPSRYAMYATTYHVDGGREWRPGTHFFAFEGTWEGERPHLDPTHLYHKCATLEAEGRYRLALTTWRWGWTHGVGCQAIVRERIALLEILKAHPRLKGAKALLTSTAAYKPHGAIPLSSSLAVELRPFALYRSIDTRSLSDEDKAKRFLSLANDYPSSPMAEPALISVPRLLLAAGDSKIRQGSVETSRLAIDDLAKRYPHSRFRFDVVGWRGRIEYLARRYSRAINQYRNQLSLAPTWRKRAGAFDSLVVCEGDAWNLPAMAATLLEVYGSEPDLTLKGSAFSLLRNTLGHIDGSQAHDFWGRLRTHPKLLALYLDYRMEMTNPTSDILALATHEAGKAFSSRYGGHIYARLAQAAFTLKRTQDAKLYAAKALEKSHSNSDKALATFLIASVAKREERLKSAQKGYEALLSQFPADYLCGGARENLAVIYEREHRLGDALDLYRKLGYEYDEAYLLDIRMSCREVEEYIESHRSSGQMDLLHFSLGIRYLRDDQFGLAQQELAHVSHGQRLKFCRVLYPGEENDKDIEPDRIQDPMQTAKELSRLYQRHRLARGMQAKAMSLARVANYYYDHHDLLLYNPALWHHMRSVGIGIYWNASIATKQDNRALEWHHWQHECYARTLTLCQRILKDYPRASVRYRVAYRAACAAERLARMNSYWRWQDSQHDLIGRAVNLMSIAKHSPDRQLAAAARKYVGVFVESRDAARQAFQDANAERKKGGDGYQGGPNWSYF